MARGETPPHRRPMEIRRPLPRALLAWASATVLSELRGQTGLSGALASQLPGHSIGHPPDINLLAADWWLAGTVIPSHDALILSPGVANRIGLVWSSSPLLTNNFEVILTFKARRPAKRSTKDDGFAVWYTYENGTAAHNDLALEHAQNQAELIADTWRTPFKEAGFDLFGYRSMYDGLGVFFLDEDMPSISAVPNDGHKTFKVGAGIPTYDAVKFDFLNGQEVVVKILVQPESAKVEVVGHSSVEVKGHFKAGGYLGFTSFGGEKLAPDAEEKSSYVEFKTVEVINHDATSKGEVHATTQAPPPKVKEEDKVDVLAEASSFKDHRAESDAIKDLTNLVFKLVVETQPMRQQMARAIDSLSKRISIMETNFAELKAELDKKTGHKLGAEFDAIKKELTTLSNVASKETQERHSKLESLHADIADVHKSAHSPDNIDKHLDKLTQSNNKVLDQLTNEHQRMFGVSIAAIAFVIISGLSLYNKFRCWEKKHIL